LEAEAFHAGHEDFMIALVAGAGERWGRLRLPSSSEGLIEGEDGMGGGGVTELTIFIEATELAEEIEGEGTGPALGGFEIGAAADDKGEAGDAFEAFVGGRDEVIDGGGGEVDGQGAEAAHGIDDEDGVDVGGTGPRVSMGLRTPVVVSQ
jgi:hypothetical protein